MKNNDFPLGWDEKRVEQVLAHCETQTEEETIAEDESAFEEKSRTVIEIPVGLMPTVRKMIAQYERSSS